MTHRNIKLQTINRKRIQGQIINYTILCSSAQSGTVEVLGQDDVQAHADHVVHVARVRCVSEVDIGVAGSGGPLSQERFLHVLTRFLVLVSPWKS